jgi:hypothetical protein
MNRPSDDYGDNVDGWEVGMMDMESNDPENPLRRAVMLARILGWGFVVLCTCFGMPPLFFANNWLETRIALILVALFMVPGIAQIVLAQFLKGYRAWAATALLTITAIQCVLFILAVVFAAIYADIHFLIPVLLIGIGVLGIDIALLDNLSACFAIIRIHDRLVATGFEPVMPVPAEPMMADPTVSPTDVAPHAEAAGDTPALQSSDAPLVDPKRTT